MLPGRENRLRRREMSIVGRSDTSEVDARAKELFGAVVTCEALKRRDLACRRRAVGFGSRAGTTSDGGQFDSAEPESWVIDAASRMSVLEERAVRFFEDHPEPDHSGSKRMD